MAATNWTIVARDKETKKTLLINLVTKWTYKQALAIAKEGSVDGTHELICVIETNKILLKDEKGNEKNCVL